MPNPGDGVERGGRPVAHVPPESEVVCLRDGLSFTPGECPYSFDSDLAVGSGHWVGDGLDELGFDTRGECDLEAIVEDVVFDGDVGHHLPDLLIVADPDRPVE